jgi:hypothetical protein
VEARPLVAVDPLRLLRFKKYPVDRVLRLADWRIFALPPLRRATGGGGKDPVNVQVSAPFERRAKAILAQCWTGCPWQNGAATGHLQSYSGGLMP